MEKPYFVPFVGRYYLQPKHFRGRRLLVIGESQYLRKPQDDYQEFIRDLVEGASTDARMTATWQTPYYRNLFYLLTGQRARTIEFQEWNSVWQSLAFYNFVQTRRLEHPLWRPIKSEWEQSMIPLRGVMAELRPELIVITGRTASGYITRGALRRAGTIGVWLRTVGDAYAFARCVYHPSARQSIARRKEQRRLLAEMFEDDWPPPNQE